LETLGCERDWTMERIGKALSLSTSAEQKERS
jgi:hypothetical protein